VLDKWFGLQILNAGPDTAAETAARLTEHPDFTLRNPNRFRAVLGALAGFPAGFHHVSGRGYRLMADMLIALDPLNPQTTARICTAFETWRRLDRGRP
jgi:aminopeptidase N